MAGILWGADVAQLRTLAQQFGKTSETLMQQATTLTSVINNNSSWKGADGARFKSDWNSSHRALIQRTAFALKQESSKLLENANEQEKASNGTSGSGGGPGTIGGSRSGSGAGGLALGGVLLGGVGGLKAAMHGQKIIKAPLTLAKHAAQYGWVLKNQSADFVKSFQQGRHRIGGPTFGPSRLLGSSSLENLLRGSSRTSSGVGFAEKVSDLASLKNLNKHLEPLARFGRVFEEKPWIGAGTKLEWLGKSGLGRTLGWAGVGFSAADSVKSFADGDIRGGVSSAFRAGLGVGCFMPPPAGTVCQVASAGIAIYENWDTICSVGKNVGEGIVNAVKDPGRFVSDAAQSVGNAGKSVTKFLAFGD